MKSETIYLSERKLATILAINTKHFSLLLLVFIDTNKQFQFRRIYSIGIEMLGDGVIKNKHFT